MAFEGFLGGKIRQQNIFGGQMQNQFSPKTFTGNVPQTSPPPPLQPNNSADILQRQLELNKNRPQQAAYRQAVANAPTHEQYQPSKMGRLFASLTGAAAGMNQGATAGIAAGTNFLNTPYNQAVEDYDRKVKGLERGAEFENIDIESQRRAYEDAQTADTAYRSYALNNWEAGERAKQWGQDYTQRGQFHDDTLGFQNKELSFRGRVEDRRASESDRDFGLQSDLAKSTIGYQSAAAERQRRGEPISPQDRAVARKLAHEQLSTDSTMGQYFVRMDNGEVYVKPGLIKYEKDMVANAIDQYTQQNLDQNQYGPAPGGASGGVGAPMMPSRFGVSGGQGGGIQQPQMGGASPTGAGPQGAPPEPPAPPKPPTTSMYSTPGSYGNPGYGEKGGPVGPPAPKQGLWFVDAAKNAMKPSTGPNQSAWAGALKAAENKRNGIYTDPEVQQGPATSDPGQPPSPGPVSASRGYDPQSDINDQRSRWGVTPPGPQHQPPPIGQQQPQMGGGLGNIQQEPTPTAIGEPAFMAGPPPNYTPGVPPSSRGELSLPDISAAPVAPPTAPMIPKPAMTPTAPPMAPEAPMMPLPGGEAPPDIPRQPVMPPPEPPVRRTPGLPAIPPSGRRLPPPEPEVRRTPGTPAIVGGGSRPSSGTKLEDMRTPAGAEKGTRPIQPATMQSPAGAERGNRPAAPANIEQFESSIDTLVKRMADLGHPVKVISKRRTAEEQGEYYKQGRSKPGKIITEKSGKPGEESRHQLGTAVDLTFTGKKKDWALLGKVAKELGLEWGGDWKSLRDYGHVQAPDSNRSMGSR